MEPSSPWLLTLTPNAGGVYNSYKHLTNALTQRARTIYGVDPVFRHYLEQWLSDNEDEALEHDDKDKLLHHIMEDYKGQLEDANESFPHAQAQTPPPPILNPQVNEFASSLSDASSNAASSNAASWGFAQPQETSDDDDDGVNNNDDVGSGSSSNGSSVADPLEGLDALLEGLIDGDVQPSTPQFPPVDLATVLQSPLPTSQAAQTAVSPGAAP